MTANGLLVFDDFYGLHGEIVSNAGKRPVFRVPLTGHGVARNYYLKKIPPISIRGLVRHLRGGIGFHGDAFKEQAQVARYERAGIPVMRIAAWGEDIRFGRPQSGFLLAREVEGERFDRYLGRCSQDEQVFLFARYGELLRRMHDSGIADLARVQDIVHAPQGELTVIDREHGLPKDRNLSRGESVNALARVYLKNLSALSATDAMKPALRAMLSGYLGLDAEKAEIDAFELELNGEVVRLIGHKSKFNHLEWLVG